MRPESELGRRTWTDVAAESTLIVVVPVGSCEQHGPHLPLDTDTTIAIALASRLADARRNCIVAPPIAVSASGEHRGFPGTLSIGTEIMAGVVIEYARSADWATGVVFVNAHGGNVTAMQRAGEVFEHERRNVLVWWPRLRDADPHAGHTETSLMLAIDPSLVRSAAAEAGPVPTTAQLVTEGVRALSPNGVLGDPSGATAAHGEALLDAIGRQLIAAVDDVTAVWTRP